MRSRQVPEPTRPRAEKLVRVARSDRSFRMEGGLWVGKCLICNGPIAFDVRTGEGATLEHIRARTRGGTDDLANLAVVHARCNAEKGVRWDPRRRRSEGDYEALVTRMLSKRADRWRDPDGEDPKAGLDEPGG